MSFPLRILLVDNDQLVLSLLAQTLETEGFDVVGVLSEASAVAAAKTFDPDLAFIDVDLGATLRALNWPRLSGVRTRP